MTKFTLLKTGEDPTKIPVEPDRPNLLLWFLLGLILLSAGVLIALYLTGVLP